MLRGLYISGTGMLTLRKQMDVNINNITNVETTGFKKDTLLSRSFKDMLIERINDPSIVAWRKEVGPLNTGIHIDEVSTAFTQGALEGTERTADFAISGDGYFVVTTPDGERFTRAGNFTRNSLGYLINSDGFNVQDVNGQPIQLSSSDFSVAGNGEITINNELVAQMRLVTFEDNGDLRKQGANLYYSYSGQMPEQSNQCEVLQGYLENSNVDAAGVVVDMLETYRAYETNQRILKMTDETLAKAVNEIGKV